MASLGTLPMETALQVLRNLDIRDLAAIAATCRGYYALANPLLYKLEVDNPESYTFYAAAGAGNVGRMRKLVDAGFDVNQTWFSPVEGPHFENIQITDLWRKGKRSKKAVVLHRRLRRERDADVAKFQYMSLDKYHLYSSTVHFDREEKAADRELPGFVGFSGQSWPGFRAYWNALHLAAACGQDEVICFLIDKGAYIDAPSESFCECPQVNEYVWHRESNPPIWSPLHVAICRGHPQTAMLLLIRGASIIVEVDEIGESENESSGIETATSATTEDPTTRPRNHSPCTALHTACSHGARGLVKTLIEDGYQSDLEVKDKFGQTPLAYAFCTGHFDSIIPYLLSKGCDIDITLGPVGENYARRVGSPLIMACDSYRYGDAIKLVELGANVNCFDELSGDSPLHICARGRPCDERGQLVHELIKAGAQIDFCNGEKGETPLCFAALALDTQMVEILIEHGADVSNLDSNILYRACRSLFTYTKQERCVDRYVDRYIDLISMLIPRGIDVNARDQWHPSVLHFICDNWEPSMHLDIAPVIKALVSHGTDVTVRNGFGLLPFQKAFYKCWLDMCPLLLNEKVKRLLSKDDITNMFRSLVGYSGGPKPGVLPGLLNLLLGAGGSFLSSQPEMLKMVLDSGKNSLVPPLVDKGTFTQFVSNSNETVLHRGCQSGLFERSAIISKLLESGVDFDDNIMDQDGETLLSFYIKGAQKRGWQRNSHPTINQMLDKGADPHQLIKQISCDYHPDYSQYERPLDIIIKYRQFELASDIVTRRTIQSDTSGYSYLHRSCSFQEGPADEQLIHCLLERGFDPNGISCFGETPLFHMLHTFQPGLPSGSYGRAISSKESRDMTVNHIDTLVNCIRLLVTHGAKWNVRNRYPRGDRWTPKDELRHLLSNGRHTRSRTSLDRLRSRFEFEEGGVGEVLLLPEQDDEVSTPGLSTS